MKLKYISFILVAFFLFVLVQPKINILANEIVNSQNAMNDFYSNLSIWNSTRKGCKSIDTYVNNLKLNYLQRTGRQMEYIIFGFPSDSYKSGNTTCNIDGLQYYLFTYDSEDIITFKNNKFFYNDVEMYAYSSSSYSCVAFQFCYPFSLCKYDEDIYIDMLSGGYGGGSSALSSLFSDDNNKNLNILYEKAIYKKASAIDGFSNEVITDFDDMPLNSLFITSPVNNASLKSYFEDNNFIDISLKGKIVYSDLQVDIIDMLLSLFGCDDVKDYVIEAIEENMRFSLTFNILDKYLDKVNNNVSTRRIVSPKVKVYGSKEDWIKNGYINFKVDGRVDIDSSLASRSDGFSIVSMCSFYENMFTVTSNSVNLLCHRWIDADGDKIDDVTGEKIIGNIVFDKDGADGDSPAEDITKGNQNQEVIVDSDSFFEWLGNTVSDIGSFFTKSSETLSSIQNDVSDMTKSIWNFFNFLPDPIPSLIKIAFVLIIFITVIRFIRG